MDCQLPRMQSQSGRKVPMMYMMVGVDASSPLLDALSVGLDASCTRRPANRRTVLPYTAWDAAFLRCPLDRLLFADANSPHLSLHLFFILFPSRTLSE